MPIFAISKVAVIAQGEYLFYEVPKGPVISVGQKLIIAGCTTSGYNGTVTAVSISASDLGFSHKLPYCTAPAIVANPPGSSGNQPQLLAGGFYISNPGFDGTTPIEIETTAVVVTSPTAGQVS